MPQSKRPRAESPSVLDKRILAAEIDRIMRERELTQTEAARIVRDAPSQLSLIVNGKLNGFSPERLIRILTRFGRDIDIRISRSSGKTGSVRVRNRSQ